MTGYCVEAKGGFTVDGTPIQLYDCNGTASQAWSRMAPAPLAWDTLFGQFARYDYNADGVAELNSLTRLNLGSVPVGLPSSPLDGLPLVVVFVDPRIVSSDREG
jgi:hypothetical protein